MTWVKIEDRFPWHRKVRGLTDAAFRLHLSAMCWCTEHLTDGAISASELHLVSDVRAPGKAAEQLVAVGLWDVTADGWEIHDYLEFNYSKEIVLARRQADADRKKRGRSNRSPGGHLPDVQADSTMDSARTDPTRPDPTQESPSDSPAAPDGFAEFWAVYPRRVGRGQAIRAFRAALKKTDADKLVAAATSYATSVRGTDEKFIPHASTWLNGERWADERPQLRAVNDDSWYPGKGGSWDV